MTKDNEAYIRIDKDAGLLVCLGEWTVLHVEQLTRQLKNIPAQAPDIQHVDCAELRALDSAGALMLVDLLADYKKRDIKIRLSGLKEKYQTLLRLVISQDEHMHRLPPLPKQPNWFYLVGEWATQKLFSGWDFLAFVGEASITLGRVILKPVNLCFQGVIQTIDDVGYQALGIVALLSFLVGIVLTYQVAVELKTYGANIYVVDLVGLIILREFGPLVTAIIAAGRTSTAFTAQIGTMKVNEEIDALRTMGISPIQRLVIPKVIGTLIAIPLLAVWADAFGVLGGMFMARSILDINYISFLHRFQEAVDAGEYIKGLIKTPVFALVIAAVGCFQGFQVASSADSVGSKTTQAAVQAIFLIIIVDAAFSVLYSWRGM